MNYKSVFLDIAVHYIHKAINKTLKVVINHICYQYIECGSSRNISLQKLCKRQPHVRRLLSRHS